MPLPVHDRGYPHPELLAETDWLASRLSDPMVRVVDARSDENYATGHIPGAVHLSGFSLGGLRAGPEMPEPEAFAQLVGSLGIDEHTPVVVYDQGQSQMAGMTAWAFLYYGHPDLRYLDGGLTKWTAEGLPLSSDPPAHEPRTFAARPMAGVFCSLEQAKAAVDDDDAIFWDVRSLGEFEGDHAGLESSAAARAPAGSDPPGVDRALRCQRGDLEACRRDHHPPGGERDHTGGRRRHQLRRRCARVSRRSS